MSENIRDKAISWDEMRKELPPEVQRRLDDARNSRLSPPPKPSIQTTTEERNDK